MKAQYSGTAHWATFPERKARSTSAVRLEPGFRTTQAKGRSLHFSSGLAITAHSSTSGWPIKAFSISTDEIHSPPDLITSLTRSVIWMKPRSLIVPTSPVRSQPSWKRSRESSR